jgi:Ca2+-binding RTX toxin-like protein
MNTAQLWQNYLGCKISEWENDPSRIHFQRFIMAVINGKFRSGFAEVINGTSGNDTIFPLGGWDTVNGGGGIDTLVISDSRANFKISADASLSYVDAISGASGWSDMTTLNGVERVVFNDGLAVALDTGVKQAGGQTALLLGAVLGQAALAAKKPLVGTVIALFDQGFTLQDLSGAVMRLDIWGLLANGGSAGATNTQIANYLLTTVNKSAPSAATLAAAVTALDTQKDPATQGNFLAALAQSAENQVQVGLVGLAQNGLAYMDA